MNAEFKPTQIEAVLKLGFPIPSPVFSLRTIAQLFGSTKSRCGIYLLEFSDRTFYIGQAVDVVRRFVQHRGKYSNITGFSFIPTKRALLDEIEVALIRAAELLSLTLLNTVYASNVVGDTDLDFIVSPQKQEAWLSASGNVEVANDLEPLVLPVAQTGRFANNFQRFKAHPKANAALEFLRLFVSVCVPLPRRTEYSFWVVSCLPSTNRGSWPRLGCISAGVMELFVVGHDLVKPKEMWGFVNVASDVLVELAGGLDLFASTHPMIEMVERNYRDAGQHQISLHAPDESSLRLLLGNHMVCKAAGVLALRVMRKRATIYGKFHCKQLADAILSLV